MNIWRRIFGGAANSNPSDIAKTVSSSPSSVDPQTTRVFDEIVRFLGYVERADVHRQDCSRIAGAVSQSVERYKSTRPVELLAFGVTGYDSAPRALCEIPEVREWG